MFLKSICRIILVWTGVAAATSVSAALAAEHCPATAAEGIASTTDNWEKYAWPASASKPEDYDWYEARLEDYRNLVECTYIDRSLAETAPGRKVALRRFYAAGYPNPIDAPPNIAPESDFHWMTGTDAAGHEYRTCSLSLTQCGWTLSAN